MRATMRAAPTRKCQTLRCGWLFDTFSYQTCKIRHDLSLDMRTLGIFGGNLWARERMLQPLRGLELQVTRSSYMELHHSWAAFCHVMWRFVSRVLGLGVLALLHGVCMSLQGKAKPSWEEEPQGWCCSREFTWLIQNCVFCVRFAHFARLMKSDQQTVPSHLFQNPLFWAAVLSESYRSSHSRWDIRVGVCKGSAEARYEAGAWYHASHCEEESLGSKAEYAYEQVMNMWRFPKMAVSGIPKSSILMGFSIIKHHKASKYWGTHWNLHVDFRHLRKSISCCKAEAKISSLLFQSLTYTRRGMIVWAKCGRLTFSAWLSQHRWHISE